MFYSTGPGDGGKEGGGAGERDRAAFRKCDNSPREMGVYDTTSRGSTTDIMSNVKHCLSVCRERFLVPHSHEEKYICFVTASVCLRRMHHSERDVDW
jgi:hypothetical protein